MEFLLVDNLVVKMDKVMVLLLDHQRVGLMVFEQAVLMEFFLVLLLAVWWVDWKAALKVA
jgi:hypothetical protein